MLKLNNIVKEYPGVMALDDVSVVFKPGEIHALMGENGAGKSTLIKIISGAIKPTSGTIEIDGFEYKSMTPSLSKKHKIAVIYQEVILCPPLSVAENIFLGQKFGKTFSLSTLCKKAKALFDEYGFNLNPRTPVAALSSAKQQLVEICKAISEDAQVIIMDEPTSSLAADEVEILFNVIRKLKAKGKTIVYISHRLDEVFEISERVTVLRDGKFVKTVDTNKLNRDELIQLMVGRKLSIIYPKRKYRKEEPVLAVEHLTGNSVDDISFVLHKGEILGFAGLVGSGRTELMEMIAGLVKSEKGTIKKGNEIITIKHPNDAINHGIGLIPEDRKIQGCIQSNSVLFNTTLTCNKKYIKHGWINNKKRVEITEYYKDKLGIKVPSIKQVVYNLSGGNQQKVVVAKTMAADLDIVIFDEPTKGIDVGAKKEIYELMNELTIYGTSIIMVSSDMEEVMGMSDRIIVLYEGKISGELPKKEFTQEKILALASGIN